MNKNDKNINYINAVCASRSTKLVGKDRLLRMADANSLEDALSILRESGFGGSDKVFSSNDFGEVVSMDEKEFISFVKEYAPNQNIANFCLMEKDFYNCEAIVKSNFQKLPVDKFVGEEGIFTVEEIKDAVENGKFGKMPRQLIDAIILSKNALDEGKGGMAVGGIFTNKKYEYLKSAAKEKYLKDIIVKEIDGLNISVCLRSQDKEVAKSMIISGGILKDNQIDALLKRDKGEIIATFMFSKNKKLALSALEDALSGKPLVELERECSSFGAQRMLEKRYNENEGTKPFMLYYFRRKNQLKAVLTVLTGKANDLDKEEIKKRIVVA